ncbi:MAG: hypothetical protein LBE13_23205, partial [Bacteroidales bacterium]|nr:hypothetical protein [Bacteroidales bacterium]
MKQLIVTIQEYEEYGIKYRDYIYNRLYPNVSQGYSPLKACCFFLWDMVTSMGSHTYLWQDFGIEYICQFSTYIPPALAQ